MIAPDAWFYRVKAAQRDLIERAGGIARVVDISGFSKSQVGRWNNGADPDLMPPNAVRLLEADCMQPLFTSIMAEVTGRRLTDPDQERAAETCVMQSHAELMRQMAELANTMALAFADGRVTPVEANTADRILAEADLALGNMRASLAAVRARGGVSSGLRVVGNDS